MAKATNPYIGKITNSGVQHVVVNPKKTGGGKTKVIKGGDLRTKGGK